MNESVTRRQLLAIHVKDQCLTGNPIDDCWRCDLNWESNREHLADCAIGFGHEAIGGRGGNVYVVTDPSDPDPENPPPGTLRYGVVQDGPLWIIFSGNKLAKSSTIQLTHVIYTCFKCMLLWSVMCSVFYVYIKYLHSI